MVIDGVVMENNLEYFNKDKKWLSTRLKKMGYDDVTSLLLVTCNTNEELTVYEKNVKELKKGCLE